MNSEVFTVEGIEETCRMLDNVGSIVATRGNLNGLEAGAKVIEDALWVRTPVDLKAAMNKAHAGKGALITRLNTWVEVDAHGRGGQTEIGFGALGFLANWLEYGFRLTTHKGKFIKQIAPTGFMRRTLDASAEPAIDAFVDGVKKTLKEVPEYTEAA